MSGPFINIDTSSHDRMIRTYANYFGRSRPAKPSNESVTGLALDGYAILYDQPLIHDNEIWVFKPDCFKDSLRNDAVIYFQRDHDNSQRLASTRNALSFLDDDVGLSFRLELDEFDGGAALKREVDTGRRSAISVGIRNDKNHIEVFGKHQVRIITKADLLEISAVADGACPNAFSGVVNADYEPFEPGDKGPTFKINFAGHKLKRLTNKVAVQRDSMRALAKRLDRLDSVKPKPTATELIDAWYAKWRVSK